MSAPVDVLAVAWNRVPGKPDYVSECGRFVAVYKRTERCGYANYWTFPANTPKRRQTMVGAVGVGGLPTRLPAALARVGGAA